MPFTRNVSVSPVTNVTGIVGAELQLVVLGEVVVDERPVVAERARAPRCEPFDPVDRDHLLRARVDRGRVLVAVEDCALAGADGARPP